MTTLFHSARKIDAHGVVDNFWMLVEADTIVATGSGGPPYAVQGIQPARRVDIGGQWLVPGFIDLHSHGGGEHSYDDGPEAITAALATHRVHGTTRTLISLVANPLAQLRESLSVIAEIAASDPLVLGSHLEGPFLAAQRCGAHNPIFLSEPLPEYLGQLLDAAQGTLRQVTLAPELAGAFSAIDVLVENNVAVAIGHTEATFELAAAAFDRGATMLTHVFNAMPAIAHRAPGPVVAAFRDNRVTIELILDGLHVHPDVAAMVFASAPGRVALITDAMAAAGANDGDYRLGSLNVTVQDGRAVLSGTSTIAGSTLTQDAALRIAILTAGVAPVEAIRALTLTPAHAIGIGDRHGVLAPGFVADAVVLDDDWLVTQVWAAGQRVMAARREP